MIRWGPVAIVLILCSCAVSPPEPKTPPRPESPVGIGQQLTAAEVKYLADYPGVLAPWPYIERAIEHERYEVVAQIFAKLKYRRDDQLKQFGRVLAETDKQAGLCDFLEEYYPDLYGPFSAGVEQYLGEHRTLVTIRGRDLTPAYYEEHVLANGAPTADRVVAFVRLMNEADEDLRSKFLCAHIEELLQSSDTQFSNTAAWLMHRQGGPEVKQLEADWIIEGRPGWQLLLDAVRKDTRESNLQFAAAMYARCPKTSKAYEPLAMSIAHLMRKHPVDEAAKRKP